MVLGGERVFKSDLEVYWLDPRGWMDGWMLLVHKMGVFFLLNLMSIFCLNVTLSHTNPFQ